MALLQIAKMGHPILRRTAKEVSRAEIDSTEFQKLVDDMIETMRDADGAGIAAPQVYVSKRVVVVEVGRNPRYPDAPKIPLTVLINPVIEPVTDEMDEGWEGCLSVENLRGVVPRYTEVRARFLDREGKPCDLTVDGFFARALQHECDHLDGVLYVDRVEDTATLSHLKEWQRFHFNSDEEPPEE